MNIIVILQEPLSASHIPYVWFPRGYPLRTNCSSYPRFEEFQHETDSKEHLFCKISKNSICVLKCLTKYFISLKNISDPPFLIWKNLLIPPFDLRKSTWSPQFSGAPPPGKKWHFPKQKFWFCHTFWSPKKVKKCLIVTNFLFHKWAMGKD